MSEFKELKLSDIFPSRTNPRSEFEENSIRELAESICKNCHKSRNSGFRKGLI